MTNLINTPFWRGKEAFYVMWFGYVASMSGTMMTRFALITWAYQQTGQATTLALLGFFSFITMVIVSPFAGVYVDRFDRRTVLMISDLGSGLMTLAIFALFTTGQLEIWHLFVAEMLTGVFDAFYIPAFAASISTTVKKDFYDRANALRSLGYYASQVGAPFMAGVVLVLTDLSTVLLIDIVTFVFAVGTLLMIRIPRPQKSADNDGMDSAPMVKQIRFAMRYIIERRGLAYLLGIFTLINLVATIAYFGVLPAMILARTGGDELVLATVQSTLGIAGVVGGVIVTIFGTPKKRIHGVLVVTAVSFILGDFVIGIGQTTIVWVLGVFLAAIFIPTISVCNNTIWQRKVAPDVQGRVFSIRTMVTNSARPIGYLLAGPLADQLFEPALQSARTIIDGSQIIITSGINTGLSQGGALVDSLGWLVGTGAGAGMGLMFVCTAIIGMTVSMSGYLLPALRNLEDDLPDFDISDDEITDPILESSPVPEVAT